MNYDYTYDIDDAVNLCAARLNAINALLTSYFQDMRDVYVANAYINSIKTNIIRSPGIRVIVDKVKEYQAPMLFSMMAYSSGCYKAKVEPFLKNQYKINKPIVDAILEKIRTDHSKYYNLINDYEMQIKTQLLKKLSKIFEKNSAEWNIESKKVFGEWEWDYNFETAKAAAQYKAPADPNDAAAAAELNDSAEPKCAAEPNDSAEPKCAAEPKSAEEANAKSSAESNTPPYSTDPDAMKFYDSLCLKFYQCDIKKCQLQPDLAVKAFFMIGDAFDGFEFGHVLIFRPNMSNGPAFEYYDQNATTYHKEKYILLSDIHATTCIYVSDESFATSTPVTPLKMSLEATPVSSSDKNKASWFFYRELDDYGRIKDTRDWSDEPTNEMLKNGYPRNCYETVKDYIFETLETRKQTQEPNHENEDFCKKWYTIYTYILGDNNRHYIPLLTAHIDELLPDDNSFLQDIKSKSDRLRLQTAPRGGSRKRKRITKYFKKSNRKSKRKSKSKSKTKRRQKK
jgi:hypothetical protein